MDKDKISLKINIAISSGVLIYGILLADIYGYIPKGLKGIMTLVQALNIFYIIGILLSGVLIAFGFIRMLFWVSKIEEEKELSKKDIESIKNIIKKRKSKMKYIYFLVVILSVFSNHLATPILLMLTRLIATPCLRVSTAKLRDAWKEKENFYEPRSSKR